MIGALAGRLTFRRVFPRLLRLLLTVCAVILVGFFGAANAAKRPNSGWAYRELPLFFNTSPVDVRARALNAMRAVARDGGPDSQRARAELLRRGGAALPHVLPQLDSLEPAGRGRVAMALGPVALRMHVASPEDISSPERALLFFGRFWQDRSIDFRPTTVRRAVERLAERSFTLRRDDVLHADTYALEALVAALGDVHDEAGAARVSRLNPVLMHITGRGSPLPRAPAVTEAARTVEGWQALWLDEGADYVVLDGPRRVAALVTETQFGKWLAQAFLWKLGRTQDGTRVAHLVASALPASAVHVLLLLLAAIGASFASALAQRSEGRMERARARVSAVSASLVASYPMVLSLVLAFELATNRGGVLKLCATALRHGDVNLVMGTLLAVTLLSDLLVTLPARLAAAGHAQDGSDDEGAA